MKRSINLALLTLLVFVIAVGCSDDDPAPCNAPTDLHIEKTWGFTNAEFEIKGNFTCIEAIESVQVNGVQTEVLSISTENMIIKIPTVVTGNSTIIITFKNKEITTIKDITLYPGGGQWKEIASFPGEGRTPSSGFIANGKAYLFGGRRFLGYEGEYPKEKFYDDIYQYDPPTNQWSFILEKAAAENFHQGYYLNDKYYFSSNPGGGQVFDPVAKTLSSVTPYLIGRAENFTINNTIYQIVNQYHGSDNSFSISVVKYTDVTNTGETVYDARYVITSFTFAFVYNNKGYFSSYDPNDNFVTLWEFNPTGNTVVDKGKLYFSSTGSPNGLKHLFTINNQAYFMASALGTRYAENPLYIYNFEKNTWLNMNIEMPEQFAAPFAFGISDRGFLGLNLTSTSPAAAFSQKFYEFIPQ